MHPYFQFVLQITLDQIVQNVERNVKPVTLSQANVPNVRTHILERIVRTIVQQTVSIWYVTKEQEHAKAARKVSKGDTVNIKLQHIFHLEVCTKHFDIPL